MKSPSSSTLTGETKRLALLPADAGLIDYKESVYLTPKYALEQYFTPEDVAAEFADWINSNCNIKGKTVTELGCGTGMITKALLRHDPKSVVALDVDKDVLIHFQNDYVIFPDNVTLIHTDVENYDGECDIIVSNPPFGNVKHGILPVFVNKALTYANHIFFLVSTRSLKALVACVPKDFAILLSTEFSFEIPKMYAHHSKEIEKINCVFVYICRNKKSLKAPLLAEKTTTLMHSNGMHYTEPDLPVQAEIQQEDLKIYADEHREWLKKDVNIPRERDFFNMRLEESESRYDFFWLMDIKVTKPENWPQYLKRHVMYDGFRLSLLEKFKDRLIVHNDQLGFDEAVRALLVSINYKKRVHWIRRTKGDKTTTGIFTTFHLSVRNEDNVNIKLNRTAEITTYHDIIVKWPHL